MDILIMRAGQQAGPYPDEAVQTMLSRGEVRLSDMAWRPGMGDWLPLGEVLGISAETVVPAPPAPAATAPGEEKKPAPAAEPAVATVDLASPRQKAFLTYLCIPYTADLTREKAALLLNDALENPQNAVALKRWDEDRLRLYPDLFADEIKARKENRAQQFLEICQTEGAEYFEGMAKAHAQVLVAYLDVHHPNWDHQDRAKPYFFAAVSEKFPQLVRKNARGRFKFPDGPRVADEVTGGTVRRSRPKRSPVAAIARGVLLGLLILAALYGSRSFLERHGRDLIQRIKPGGSPTPAVAAAEITPPPITPAPTPSLAFNEPSAEAATPAERPRRPKRKAPESEATPQPGVAVAAAATPTPSPEPASTTTPEPVPSVVALATPLPATPPPRTSVTITRATTVVIPFGNTILNSGTSFPFVGVEGTKAMIRFGPNIVRVPLENTDLGEKP